MGKLPNSLKKAPFTFRQGVKMGLTQYQLRKWLEDGTLEQLARGIYRHPEKDMSEIDLFKVAVLKVGKPSTICLVSALAYYGLTDTIPKKTWVMVLASKRASYSDLKLFRTRRPTWNIGLVDHGAYAITSLERTLVDILCARARVGTQIGIEALQKALKMKKTTAGKIVEMARELGVTHRVMPYIEALS